MSEQGQTRLTEMDEAELRVMYRNCLRAHGTTGLMQCITAMIRCTNIALEVLKENW